MFLVIACFYFSETGLEKVLSCLKYFKNFRYNFFRVKNETFYVQIKKNNFLKTNSYLLADNRFLAALWARYLF